MVDVQHPGAVIAKWRVIYGDTDQMGVVYYANYLRYFEASRNEFFRQHGGNYAALEREGYALPIIEANVQYKAPARYDDLLEVRVWISELRRVSLRFDYDIHREGDERLLTTGSTVHACVGRAGTPTRFPESLLALLRRPVAPPPSA
jgi:acyl-CoA thioester hydrolase